MLHTITRKRQYLSVVALWKCRVSTIVYMRVIRATSQLIKKHRTCSSSVEWCSVIRIWAIPENKIVNFPPYYDKVNYMILWTFVFAIFPQHNIIIIFFCLIIIYFNLLFVFYILFKLFTDSFKRVRVKTSV